MKILRRIKNMIIGRKNPPKKPTKKYPQFNYYIFLIMREMGWDELSVKRKYRETKKRTGCTMEEYWFYEMYKLSDEENDAILVTAFIRPLRRVFNANKEFVHNVISNKANTNIFFKDMVKRAWCFSDQIQENEFIELFSDVNRIMYKPLSSSCGRGIKSFDIRHDNIKQIYDLIKTYPDGIVEEYIRQHEKIAGLYPCSVNTVRVVTFSANYGTANKPYMDIAYASLRIGNGNAIVDNFHSGGMVANIDMATGKIITNAIDMNRNEYVYHPITGVKIQGFQVPFFKETLEAISHIISQNSVNGCLGWDIAITENGPELVEVNSAPGVVLLQAPYLLTHEGKRKVLEKYVGLIDR